MSKTRKGFVRFVGPTEFAPGIWVGVELEEPRGKNNGTVDGKKYFNCKVFRDLDLGTVQEERPNFGLFNSH